MTAPVAHVRAVTLKLDLIDAPPLPMPYSRVAGRQYRPSNAEVTYYEVAGKWHDRIRLGGYILKKDGTAGEQRTERSFHDDRPAWVVALVDEHRPAVAR